MVFWNRKEKEKIYDCTNEEEYFKYRKNMYEKYLGKDLKSLKHIKFIVEAKLEKRRDLDIGIVLTLILALFTFLFEIVMKSMELNYSRAFSNILLIVYVLLVFSVILRIINELRKSNNDINNSISMLKLEKQVLEELIAEKSKHKAKVKVRKK